MKNIIYIILLFMCYSANSQSFSVFKADPTSFPFVKAKFYAFDTDGNQITNLNPSNFEVKENGIPRTVTNVSCGDVKEPIALSSVLVIDISKSMLGQGLEIAKSAASAWINLIQLGKSECAVTSFNTGSYVNQDFTTDKSRLLNSLTYLYPMGGTDYDVAMIGSNKGAIDIAKSGKHKRVIVFLSDGNPMNDPNTTQIINEAINNNISIYCVTVNGYAPQCMKDFSNRTGGLYFENISTIEEAEDCYHRILSLAQGGEPCELEWQTGVACNTGFNNTQVSLNPLNITSSLIYPIQNDAIARLDFSPSSIQKLKGSIGVKKDTTITVTAVNSNFNITNITSSNPAYTIEPTNFNITSGQSRSLKISYTPTDSSYSYNKFTFENDNCPASYFASGGFSGIKPKIQTLKLTHPNGGEKFVVGADTIITWEGILPSDKVKLEYSVDDGLHWSFLTDTANNFKYVWKNIPSKISNKCLVRATQLADTAKILKPGTLLNTLNAKVYPSIWWLDPRQNVFWSPDSKLCAVASIGNSVIICDALIGELKQVLIGDQSIINSIIWSPNGDFMATVCGDGTIKIWDPKIGSKLFTLQIPSYSLNDAVWSPDGNYIASPCDNGTAIIWDALSGSLLKTLIGHTNMVKSIKWSPNGQYIGTSSSDRTSKIWDFGTSSEIYTFSDSTLLGYINNMAWSPQGNFISAKTSIGAFAVWDASTKELLNLFYGDGVWSQDDSRVSLIDSKNHIIIYDAKKGNIIHNINEKSSGITGLCWNPDGTKLAASYLDSTAVIWDALTEKKLLTLKGHKAALANISWSPDGSRVATMSVDTTAKIWFVDNLPMEVQTDKSDSVFSIVAPKTTSMDVDMGKCLVNSTKDSIIIDFIRNLDLYKFRVDSIYFTGPDASAFKLLSGSPKYELRPGEGKMAQFGFTPHRVGLNKAIVNIITQSAVIKQNIQGEGVEPQLEIISKLLDFGQVDIGSVKTFQDTALIKNVSGLPIIINDVVQLGPDKTQFKIISGGGQFTLQPLEGRKLTVSFEPKFIGRTSGQIGFNYSGIGSPAIVQLFGASTGGLLLSIPNDSAYAGEIRVLKLMMKNVKLDKIAALASNFEAKIRFQKTILTPIDKSNRNIVNDSIYMNIHGNIGQTLELAKIPVIAGLGTVEESSIDIVDFKLKDNLGNIIDFDSEKESGTFKLLGICREGGTRLINPTGKVEILSIIPNPASEDIEIKLNLIEDGSTTISIYNISGSKLEEYNLSGRIGLQTISIDVKDFGTGLFFIQLQTPTVLENQKLMIIK